MVLGKGEKLAAQGKGKPVAIVVPLYQETLTPEEEISVKHLVHFLGRYPKYLVAPKSLKAGLEGFGIKRFDDKYFKTRDTYSDLLLSKGFYQTFSDYEYILIYQLDALVFSDQLLEWCDTGLDYVGAPWLKSPFTEFITHPAVGNGGFSLRKIQSFLKVFESKNYCVDPDKYWERFCAGRSKSSQYLNLPRKYLKRLRHFNGVHWETSRWSTGKSSPHPNEDCFWSFEAIKYHPDFRIATVEEGLRFAFETVPRQCFQENKQRLPFGCHAWAKYDIEFWKPFLLE